MKPRATGIAAALTRLWVRCTTAGVSRDLRDRRRREIESELWERQRELRSRGKGRMRATVETLGSLLCGIADDLAWRRDARRSRPSTTPGTRQPGPDEGPSPSHGAPSTDPVPPGRPGSRRNGNPLDDLRHDVRFGLRALRRTPVFTAVAVSCLALGIGASTAIFSLVNGVLLRSLPYAEPGQLVILREYSVERGAPAPGDPNSSASYPNFLDWRAQAEAFTDMALSGSSLYVMLGGDEPERLRGAPVTTNWFDLLGVSAALGRTLVPGETGSVVVLSDQLWRRSFGADPDALGRTIRLNDEPFEIVGVMPPGFRLAYSTEELWVPLEAAPRDFVMARLEDRDARGFRVIGRLAPGATLERARTELDLITDRLREEYPEANESRGLQAVPLHETQVGRIRPMLLLLLGAVGLVLLIACVNVANLLLARATSRGREVAVRSALGAARWRIVRQLLTESTLLALAGGAIGLVLAGWSASAIRAMSAGDIPRLDEVGLDLNVLGCAFLVSLAAGWLFGLVPALRASRLDPGAALRGTEPGAWGTGPGRRLRDGLVVAEVALALVLLLGAGLTVSSFRYLWTYEPGFDPRGVLTVDIPLERSRYPEAVQREAFFERIFQRLRGIPGVEAVGGIGEVPGRITRVLMPLRPPGSAAAAAGETLHVPFSPIGGDYFETMRISFLAGRRFRAGESNVAIANETFVRELFPGEPAVGKRLATPWETPYTFEIVGVVEDQRFGGLDPEPRPELFVPSGSPPSGYGGLVVVLRTRGDPAGFAGTVREVVRSLDPDQPIESLQTMEQVLADTMARPRFYMAVFGLFGALALALAAAGVFGVASYSVSRRTHELGVRIALGAGRRDLLTLIVGRGASLAGLGIVIGLAAAAGLAQYIESLLHGVSATDPGTVAGATLLLAAVALLAFYLPARRAAGVDPVATLRQD